MSARNHPMMSELLGYLDGELGQRTRESILKHLAGCVECRGRLMRLKDIDEELRTGSSKEGKLENGAHGMQRERALLSARLAAMDAHAGNEPGWRPQLRILAYATALVMLTATCGWLWKQHMQLSHTALALPNPAYTPGATRQVTLSELCAAKDDEVVRSVPAQLRQRVFQEYGVNGAHAGDFEVDYLITPGLGEADEVTNLWPQPHGSEWNSYVKDQLEDHLHHMVCRGQMPLEAAQRAIASNWIDAYKRYFNTERPLASGPGATPGAEAQLQRPRLPR